MAIDAPLRQRNTGREQLKNLHTGKSRSQPVARNRARTAHLRHRGMCLVLRARLPHAEPRVPDRDATPSRREHEENHKDG